MRDGQFIGCLIKRTFHYMWQKIC